MRVLVFPPGIGGTQGYTITTQERPIRFATRDGNWVDFDNKSEEAVFPSARDAIKFSEARGWIIANKIDDNSVLERPPGWNR